MVGEVRERGRDGGRRRGLGRYTFSAHLVKISNSKIEMWSLSVRSMVDLSAMASSEE